MGNNIESNKDYRHWKKKLLILAIAIVPVLPMLVCAGGDIVDKIDRASICSGFSGETDPQVLRENGCIPSNPNSDQTDSE